MKIAAPVIAVAIASCSLVEGAFTVHRVDDPGTMAASAPVATIATSPFDDAATRLIDTSSYFYAVMNQAGQSVPITVQRNQVAGGLRLSFDDGDPASAPVSAALSSLSVAPASIRADGVQAAVVTILPRDASGVLLGRGMTVVIDGGQLWPGYLDGPVEDLGDGSYRARVVSMIPGDAVVGVTVEGVPLGIAPAVSFTPLDPNGSLRDLAILRLRDLTSTGNRFAALEGEAAGRALDEARVALVVLANGDESRDDNVLKIDLDNALRALAPLLDDAGTEDDAAVRDLMNDLLDVARLIALYHLDSAMDVCGPCLASTPNKVCDAADDLFGADAERTVLNPDWSAVLDRYARSVEFSVQAANYC